MAASGRGPKPEGLVVVCPTCKAEHSDLTENAWLQRKYYCRICRKEQSKVQYQKFSSRILNTRKATERDRAATLKYRYGITLEEWDRLVEEQHGACLICNFRPESPRQLHVDHNHQTGEVRGLLCNNCNVGLGYFADNAERLARASMYVQLTTHKTALTTEKSK